MAKLLEKPVVIGAGPAGLCVAWDLATDGVQVRVLEKTNEVGGLALTFQDGEYLFDLGPHNIHTVYRDIYTFLRKMLGEDLRQHYPEVQIFFRDGFVSYPLKGIHVFATLPLWTVIPAGLSFLWARLKMFIRNPKNDSSFESWIKNRFGNKLYNVYFGPYAEKAWKINASEISSYVAEKRVPILSLTDYIRRLFKKPPKYFHSEDFTLINNYYPRKGVGQITNYLTKGIIENNGSIEKNVEILSFEGNHGRVESIRYNQNGKIKTMPTDFLFNTMPINDFIKILKLDVPEEVREAANGLDYCSETLLYLKTSQSEVFDVPLTYFSSPKIKFNRIYDVGAFSRDCVPPGKTALCVEYTCNIGDDVWNATSDELYDYAMSVFEAYGMLYRKDVDGYLVKCITHAYPRFRIGFQKRLKTVLDYLSTLENVVTLGRQGLFCYANVDDVLYMGFRVNEMLHTLRKKGIDYSVLFPRHVAF